jgi:hypothetical protein
MAIEPAQPDRSEPNASVPDERERLIESIYLLISAGRPLSEVLLEAKRLAASPNRAPNPDPIEKLRAGLVARAQENNRRFRMPELAGRTAGWLALTFGAAVLVIAGATLFAILPASDATAVVPSPIEKPALDPSPKKLFPLSAPLAANAPSSSPVTQKSAKTEQVSRLIDGGDVFVRRADLRSARVLYERAVDFGDAQAALRLGASYDPAVLSSAGIRGEPGDTESAIYWYKRARDLGAVSEAEVLLKKINSK